MIEVTNGGLLSTVQDLGRSGVMKNGFTQSGAMDSFSMKIANRIVCNDENAPVVEMTVFGMSGICRNSHIICLCGGDFDFKINGVNVKMNKAYQMMPGDEFSVGAAKSGVRAYLAVNGGFDCDIVFGSASTDIKSEIGGLNGRKIKKGDKLNVCSRDYAILPLDGWEYDCTTTFADTQLRVVMGPQDDMFTQEDKKLFLSQKYTVTAQSDRMGIRLDGEPLKGIDSTDIISDAIVFGSVQVPRSGLPIILAADHQTTGGYAKIATVISADLHKLAQAAPSKHISFTEVSVKHAEKAAIQQKKFFEKLFGRKGK